jgi:pimeloyl-ACP methyl ester carboxylesterase
MAGPEVTLGDVTDTILPPRVEGTVQVAAARRLSFAEFGPIHGKPVFWLHGTPGARRQIPQAARLAASELGLRIVGVDRPGVGESTPFMYGSIAQFASDLRVVADELQIGRFGLIGLSGGAPYLLACCHAMPERVVAGAVLGGVAPVRGDDAAEGGVLGRLAPFGSVTETFLVPLSIALSTLVRAVRPLASPIFDAYARISPEGDRMVLSRPEMKAMFLDDLIQGSRTGIAAPLYDLVLFSRPWGFALADIKTPIRWWHGDADHLVPLSHGEHVVSQLPDAKLTVRPGESHLGGLDAAEEVLGAILDLWDRRPNLDGSKEG